VGHGDVFRGDPQDLDFCRAAHSQLHNVCYRLDTITGFGGIVGAQVGTRLVELVPTPVFQRIFAVVLVLIAVKMFFHR
jgi:uncharacterized membrane protein YfcA